MSASCRHATHEALCEACEAEDEYLDAVAQRWQEPLRIWTETGHWPGAKEQAMPKLLVTESEWDDVARLMRLSIRGRLGVPDSVTFRLLEKALAADPDRYRELHASIKEQAVRELSLQPEKDE